MLIPAPINMNHICKRRTVAKHISVLLALLACFYLLPFLFEKPVFNDEPSFDYDDSILLKYEQALLNRSKQVDKRQGQGKLSSRSREISESPFIFIGGYGRSGKLPSSTSLLDQVETAELSFICFRDHTDESHFR